MPQKYVRDSIAPIPIWPKFKDALSGMDLRNVDSVIVTGHCTTIAEAALVESGFKVAKFRIPQVAAQSTVSHDRS